MKNKYIFPILGVVVGILFSLWEALISYGDTASPSEPIKEMFFNAISNNFFNENTLVYVSIGIGTGLLLNFIINMFKKEIKKHTYFKIPKTCHCTDEEN